ncbi:hypothetical protein TIFTF001_014556 [Ficus carica]|uniref:Uncharacterized protein n=1 Tax=Ficus carica TaxID=3494 RepID=A0AA88D5Q7_FICCA|nr:hypothetical protein TIFTF001_014556 [Ficus carica]
MEHPGLRRDPSGGAARNPSSMVVVKILTGSYDDASRRNRSSFRSSSAPVVMLVIGGGRITKRDDDHIMASIVGVADNRVVSFAIVHGGGNSCRVRIVSIFFFPNLNMTSDTKMTSNRDKNTTRTRNGLTRHEPNLTCDTN